MALPLGRLPGAPFLHGRLWETDPARRGRPAPFAILRHSPPVDLLDDDYPLRLTTGRRLDSYNTGVQSSGFASPLRRGETVEVSPRTPRGSAWSRARRSGSPPGGARWSRRSTSTRPCAPGWSS
nr:hypothetical protein GCM10020093_106850 [Planobispora longispora]